MKNVFATIVGFAVASFVVYFFESLIGHTIFPLPEGADATNLEWLKTNMHLVPLGSKIFVVIAHFMGIIAGMYIAAKISKRSMVPSHIVGVLMLAATFFTIIFLPKELWFSIADGLLVVIGYFIGNSVASKFIVPEKTT